MVVSFDVKFIRPDQNQCWMVRPANTFLVELINLISKETIMVFYLSSRGRTYVMISYVSKENNLGPVDKIRYIWGLKSPIFIL